MSLLLWFFLLNVRRYFVCHGGCSSLIIILLFLLVFQKYILGLWSGLDDIVILDIFNCWFVELMLLFGLNSLWLFSGQHLFFNFLFIYWILCLSWVPIVRRILNCAHVLMVISWGIWLLLRHHWSINHFHRVWFLFTKSMLLLFVVDLPVHFNGLLSGSNLFDVVPEIVGICFLKNRLVVFDRLRKVHL